MSVSWWGPRGTDTLSSRLRGVTRFSDRAGGRDRVDAVRGTARHRLEHRRRRRRGTGRVRRAGLLRVVAQAEPRDRHECGLSAAHPRGGPPVGARARDRDDVRARRVALADPRADPTPALQLLAALAA